LQFLPPAQPGKNFTGRRYLRELCSQAAVEQDPQKLMALVKEINELLSQKERRLKGLQPESEVT